MGEELLSIRQAARWGIERLRRPTWASKLNHIKIDILDGKPGPMLHLYFPINKKISGCDPVDEWLDALADISDVIFEPYFGPPSDSREYREAVAQHARPTD